VREEEILAMTGQSLTIAIPLNPTDDIDIHKLVAVDENGNIIGGTFDPETGLFTFDTDVAGDFQIVYIPTLRRLTLGLDSFTIIDLAGNVSPITMDVLPVFQGERTLLPLRFVAYALGATIDYTPATVTSPLTVSLTLGNHTLIIPIDTLTPELTELGMDIPAQIIDGRTMVPLRFVAEFFGAVVTWDEDARTIEILK